MKMTSLPVILDASDASLAELLDALTKGTSTDVRFARVNGRVTFVCRTEHLPPAFERYLAPTTEDTLDLVVNLGLQPEDALEKGAWVTGTLPSIEELERELFVQDFVPEKFFPVKREKVDEGEEEHVTLASEDRSEKDSAPLPRLKVLRNVLLRNHWKAQFVVDERTCAPRTPQYSCVQPGHYEIVSLPDARLQFYISDDRQRGTFVIRNIIDPDQFTRISMDEFMAKYGATRVKFDSPEQFDSALETEIREQLREPITIYPVASSYPTPLDSFPNDEAIRLLTRDVNAAATMAGKSVEDLTVGDFAAIESGPVRWSFGGVAGGGAYLDRIATEFGLDASELNKLPPTTEPIKQYEFRERILRLILWEISPEYRKERQKHYEAREKHGYYHSVVPRKRRNGESSGRSSASAHGQEDDTENDDRQRQELPPRERERAEQE